MEKIALSIGKGLIISAVIIGFLNIILAYTALLPVGSISWTLVILVALAVGVIDALIEVKFPTKPVVLAFLAEFFVTLIALIFFNWLITAGLFMEYGKLTLEFVMVAAIFVGLVKTGIDRFSPI